MYLGRNKVWLLSLLIHYRIILIQYNKENNYKIKLNNNYKVLGLLKINQSFSQY